MKKTPFFFALLFLSFFLEKTNAQQFSSEPCGLSAPASFWVTSLTSTSVSLEWSPVANSTGYKINLFVLGDTIPISVVSLSDSTVNYTFSGLTPGVQYRIDIYSLCPGERQGNEPNSLIVVPIVLELIAGYEDPNSSQPKGCGSDLVYSKTVTCEFMAFDGTKSLCEFYSYERNKLIKIGFDCIYQDINQIWFKLGMIPITNYMNVGDRYLRLVSDDNQSSSSHTMFFKIQENNGSNEIFYDLARINIGKNGVNNFTFSVTLLQELNGKYKFQLYGNQNGGSFREDEYLYESPSILPNPTTTTLQIQIPQTFNSPIQGTLLNLSGAVVQRYGLEAGVNTVSTENLSPGIYFLRLEGPGYAETFKVVKVE